MKKGEAVVSVRDNGIGISSEMLPKVFDLFSQSGNEEESMQGGMGIGLALAQRLVELHGGRIEAHSDGINLGAEFHDGQCKFHLASPAYVLRVEFPKYGEGAQRGNGYTGVTIGYSEEPPG